MIIKAYHPNGVPNLARWQVQCDNTCPVVGPLIGSRDWLIPINEQMPTYCPACVDYLAMCAICWALTCPNCHSANLRMGTFDGQPDNTADQIGYCVDCGAIYDPQTGWRFEY